MEEIIKQIIGVMQADNGVQLCPNATRNALQLDLDTGVLPPTPAEIDLLVMGDDEGCPPKELRTRYANLDAFLETHF